MRARAAIAALLCIACGEHTPPGALDVGMRDGGARDDAAIDTDAGAPSEGGVLSDGGVPLTVGCPSPLDAEGRCVGTIAVGEGTACAIVGGGGVWCWGNASLGLFGDGHPDMHRCASPEVRECSATPVAAHIGGMTRVSLSTRVVCAQGDAVYCWGDATGCSTGRPAPMDALFAEWIDAPVVVDGTPGTTHLSTFATDYDPGVCVLSAGDLVCWGPATGSALTACTLTTLHTGPIDDFAMGWGNAYFARTGDAWVAWGSGSALQPAGSNSLPTPVPFPVPSGTVEIAIGWSTGFGRTTTGEVVGWGLQFVGELGMGELASLSTSDVAPIALPEPATRIVASNYHACALLASGRVACWGDDRHGEIGDGPAHDRCLSGTTEMACAASPALVVGLDDAIDLAAGIDSTCARRANGRIVCWGAGAWGQLGNGSFASADAPVAVVGL